MCLAIPHRIRSLIDETRALASAGAVETEIRTDFVPGVEVGDVVLVHAGFAIEHLLEENGREVEALWEEVRRLANE
ncbi:MAG TPA: HypC/HybG/HupF family hydrogenase formation chaperone [Synergistales bacterium]|jgi:hydrogenase expression/formation protein HypC|nr:HypC/HybG/HupF family hydrogenase formation chaperone [Synergistales bacterium]HRV70485.1 HypC/HybG/HupF family hydrogenase formation chaperone [Thermovirgaceae bacterium]